MSRQRAFLALGYGLLVVSVFLPFASNYYEFERLVPILYPHGVIPEPLPEAANRIYFWSFMQLRQTFEKTDGVWTLRESHWRLFSDYWNSYGAGRSNVLPSQVLIPMFASQIGVLLWGLVALSKSDRLWTLWPLLLSVSALSFLYAIIWRRFYATSFIGFWLLIIAEVSITIPVIYSIVGSLKEVSLPSPN